MKDINIYSAADQAIQIMNRDMLRDFGGFAMAGSANAVLEAGRGVASSVGEIVRRFL